MARACRQPWRQPTAGSRLVHVGIWRASTPSLAWPDRDQHRIGPSMQPTQCPKLATSSTYCVDRKHAKLVPAADDGGDGPPSASPCHGKRRRGCLPAVGAEGDRGTTLANVRLHGQYSFSSRSLFPRRLETSSGTAAPVSVPPGDGTGAGSPCLCLLHAGPRALLCCFVAACMPSLASAVAVVLVLDC